MHCNSQARHQSEGNKASENLDEGTDFKRVPKKPSVIKINNILMQHFFKNQN